jgi:DNA-binding response OmpR family regulator
MAYKLVVADASPSVQKAVQLAFPAADWDITPYDNGLELSKAVFESHPDAILVSLTLPGMDGYAVGRFIRKQEEFRDTVLVFLRGTFEIFDPQRAEGVDYDEVIAKPFDSAKLVVRIKNLIDAKGEHSGFPESPIPAEAKPPARPAAAPAPDETAKDTLNLTGFSASPKASASKVAPASAPAAASVSASTPTPTSIQSPAPAAGAPVPPASAVPLSPADLADLERRLKEWLSKELVGMEREVEKRVRNQITIELKRWFAEHYISLPSKGK